MTRTTTRQGSRDSKACRRVRLGEQGRGKAACAGEAGCRPGCPEISLRTAVIHNWTRRPNCSITPWVTMPDDQAVVQYGSRRPERQPRVPCRTRRRQRKQPRRRYSTTTTISGILPGAGNRSVVQPYSSQGPTGGRTAKCTGPCRAQQSGDGCVGRSKSRG